MGMNPKHREFVRQYLIDFNGSKAAVRAGYSDANPGQVAFQLLQIPLIMQEIQDEQERRASAAGLDANWVLHQWKQIAEADPNDLISMRLDCCRYCYGIRHAYQWTQLEYVEACERASAHICTPKCSAECRLKIFPSCSGGFGFDPHREPHADCPKCHGDGMEKVKVEDTRKLKGSARRLYAGLKQNKDGSIQILMRDQDAALNNIAKYLGMVIDKRELSGPDGKPVPVAYYDAKDLTDDQLAAIIMADEGGNST